VSAPSLPPPGRVIADKYVVEEVIGEGGMGAVVAARHQTLGQRVAIKLLRGEALGHADAVERFLREARASVAIKSEHVARVIDVGTLDGGAPYMLMEHLEGVDLQHVLDRGAPLPIDVAVDYVLQACEAMAEAHHRHIVHRDLKPSNLFLTQRTDGSHLIKVLDFGIAKALDHLGDDAHLTATGTALGTPIYMSPEQVRNAKDVDPRTDIWGLGSILYHLLTGRPPYEADTIPALCAMIVADPYPTMLDLRPDIPPELDRIVESALSKQREDRQSDVARLAEDLASFAPPHALVHVERAVNIMSGGGTSLAGKMRAPAESLADTVASQPGVQVTNADAGESAAAAAPPSLEDEPALDRTAEPWQTGTRKRRPATLVGLGGLVVVVAGVALYATVGNEDPPSSRAEPLASTLPTSATEPEPPGAEPSAMSTASSDPSTAVAAATAAPSASSAPPRKMDTGALPSAPKPTTSPAPAPPPAPLPHRKTDEELLGTRR
jgi:serine/threonine-protein kinase